MSRIVTGPDGTRYRHVQERCVIGHLQHFAGEKAQSSCVDELHRIPNWPLPGPAPQYLLSSREWKEANLEGGPLPFREGDLVAATSHVPWVEWEIFSPMRGGHNIDIWYLVARADPEADHDE